MIGRRALLAGTAGVVAATAACGRPGATPTASGGHTKVTVGLTYIPNIQFSPFYVGVDRKLFAEDGLEVTLRHHGQQEDLFGAVLKGEEDIVFASADEAMVAASKGQKLQTFATAYQTYPIEIMNLQGSSSLADLSGATLGIPGHYGSNYYAALVALHSAGLTEAQVKLTDIGYTQVSALTTGKIDFIAAFRNNELVQLRAQQQKVTSVPIAEEARLVGPSLITAGKLDAGILAKVAHGMQRAEQLILDDPAVAMAATIKQVPTLSDPVQKTAAEAVLKATSELWLVDGQASVAVDEAAFTRMGETLKQAGIITTVPEDAWLRV